MVGLLGTPFGWSQEQLCTKTQGSWVVSLSCVSAVLLRWQKNFWVIGYLEFMRPDHLQWFVFYACPSDFPGLFRSCIPNPAACSFIRSVNKQSLRLLHKCQCMNWPLREPVMGAVTGPSGKGTHPQDVVSCSPTPELGLSCPLEAGLLILVACVIASSIVFSDLSFSLH